MSTFFLNVFLKGKSLSINDLTSRPRPRPLKSLGLKGLGILIFPAVS